MPCSGRSPRPPDGFPLVYQNFPACRYASAMFSRGSAFRFLSWVALLVAGLVAGPATAAPIALHACVLRAQPGLSARLLFDDPGRFDCRTPQQRLGSGDFWVRSGRLPPSAAAADEIVSAAVWQDRATIHILYADGAIRSVRYTSRTTGSHLKLGAMVHVALPHRAAPPIRLLWHIEGATNLRGIVLGATLLDQADAVRSEVLLASLYGGFAGMAIAMLVCNLALWAALRQTFQPAFCLLLLCIVCYAGTSSGALGEWLPDIENTTRLRLNGFLLGASGAAVVFFARSFFERAVFAGWLGRISGAVSIGVFATGTMYALFAPWQAQWLDGMVAASFTGLMLLVPMILWRAWTLRSNYLWLFAFTWGGPVTLAGIRILTALGVIPWTVWIDNSTLISMALEVILSSVAIAYRIHLLSRERDQAQARESAALHLAEIDPLTGLLNRRAFLSRAIGRAGEQTLLLADIDHFKHVNDTIGHDGGDEVLRVFSRALRAAVPADALVSRFGGEEFAIVVDVDADLAASDILDRLRAQRMPFDLRVTASIGTCNGVLARESDWKALYRCADRALFEAKASGRDRTRAAPAQFAA